MVLQPHRLEFKPHRLEFIFAMVLAMAVTILAITTWAAPRILTTTWLRRSRRFTGLTTRFCTKGVCSACAGPSASPNAQTAASANANVPNNGWRSDRHNRAAGCQRRPVNNRFSRKFLLAL